MSIIGIRPTLKEHSLHMEVNIFDFSADLYGKTIKMLFIDRIRDEHKFKDLEALKERLLVDRKEAVERLGRYAMGR